MASPEDMANEGDGETRVAPRPKRMGFESDSQDASPNESTGRIDMQGAGAPEQTGSHRPGLGEDEHTTANDVTGRHLLDMQRTRVTLPPEDTLPPDPQASPPSDAGHGGSPYGSPDEGDGATRVGPSPDLRALAHMAPASMQDAETRIAPSPVQQETAHEDATRVGPSPYTPGPHDAETRIGPAPSSLQDMQARLGHAESSVRDAQMQTTESQVQPTHALSQDAPPAPHEDAEATRVAPSPQYMAPQGSKTEVAPPPAEALKSDRKVIKTVGLPADLRLPTFDFKASDSPDVVAAKASGAHTTLPEHLQLPTFPDLGKPPVAKTEVSVPPPVPKKAAPPPLPQMHAPAPPVIDLSLPELAPRTTQRNLTLISSSQKNKRVLAKRLLWPTVVAVLCAVIGLGLFFARERVVAVLAPKRPPPVAAPPTAQERAKTALAAGNIAYEAKEYQSAIQHLEEALAADPRLVDAHRSLGIVYATMHDQAKAVRHYQDYLALSPHAEDATAVLKIIEDYKHAQAKGAHDKDKEAPPAGDAPTPAKHRRGGRGQSGHRHP